MVEKFNSIKKSLSVLFDLIIVAFIIAWIVGPGLSTWWVAAAAFALGGQFTLQAMSGALK